MALLGIVLAVVAGGWVFGSEWSVLPVRAVVGLVGWLLATKLLAVLFVLLGYRPDSDI